MGSTGRPGGRRGSDPPWLAPTGWPAELRDPLDHLAWSAVGSRVWLWSPAGYVLAHRRTRGDPAARARRSCRRFEAAGGATRDVDTAAATADPAAAARGAARRLPASARPLGGGGGARGAPPAAAGDRGRALACAPDRLRVPARLYVTSSHVDVVLALRDIDLRVRRAGLDRDPGWKPAFGRVISFHFE